MFYYYYYYYTISMIDENGSTTSDESISFSLGVSECGTNEDDNFVLV